MLVRSRVAAAAAFAAALPGACTQAETEAHVNASNDPVLRVASERAAQPPAISDADRRVLQDEIELQ